MMLHQTRKRLSQYQVFGSIKSAKFHLFKAKHQVFTSFFQQGWFSIKDNTPAGIKRQWQFRGIESVKP